MFFFNDANRAFMVRIVTGIITVNYDLLVNDANKGFAMGIIMLCFADSFIDKMMGISILKIMKQMFKNKVLNPKGVEDPLDPPRQDTWVNWIGNTNSLFIMICKVIFTIIYWLIKFLITQQMIPFSVYIIYFYFFYNLFFGIYNNTDEKSGLFDKIELISRVFYTKFSNVKDNNIFVLFIKYVYWFAYSFMYEIILFSILIVGLQSYAKYIEDQDLKNVLYFTYLSAIILICVWGSYKYKFYIGTLSDEYNPLNDSSAPPQGIKNKRIEINAFLNCKDLYENKTGNNFFSILFGSDSINEEVMNEYFKEQREKYEQEQANPPAKTGFAKFSDSFMKKFEPVGNFFKEKTDKYTQKANDYAEYINATTPNETELLKRAPGAIKNWGQKKWNNVKDEVKTTWNNLFGKKTPEENK
jgi:hypothetical protein